jgi:CheY-like chemotaxis protein
MVVNLVVNARDAMPEGGCLEIVSERVELTGPRAALLGVECGAYAVLHVRDTGVGIDEETKSHVFEPFFTTKEPGKGTGLGLATAYGLVTQSGGAIQVESAPGAGSTFSVYLPEFEESRRPDTTPDPTEAEAGLQTILLVEDEASVRRFAERILTDSGYAVLLAVDAEEALRLTRDVERPIDLLLTDVVLPGMGGRELAERLRASNPELRVLFASGYPDDAVLRHGIAGRRAAYLGKPFSGDKLREAVRRALGNGSSVSRVVGACQP